MDSTANMAMLAPMPVNRMIGSPIRNPTTPVSPTAARMLGMVGICVWARNSGSPGRMNALKAGQQVCQAAA